MSHETYRRLGRVRAARHRDVIERTVAKVESVMGSHGVDRGEVLAEAEAIEASIPDRYVAEAEGMAEVLAVGRDELRIYHFGGSAIRDRVTPGEDHGPPGEGCSNLLIPGDRAAAGAPLALKNRDISARGIRPQVVTEAPELAGANGWVSLTTAGHVLVYQGLNEAGLAVANTFVDQADESLDEDERVRNGALVRSVLERCDTVDEAVAHVRDTAVERLKGLTLFLADDTDATVLEVDPRGPRVERVADGVTPRTNHFPGEDPGESSGYRLDRLHELVADLPGDVTAADLLDVARDHRNGPGPNSICRHPNAGQEDPHILSESTTVGTSIFLPGEGRLVCVPGNPCEGHATSYRVRGRTLDELETKVERFGSD